MGSPIDSLRGNAREFAIACVNMNSVSELQQLGVPDIWDMESWSICPEEWLAATEAALLELSGVSYQ